MRRQEPGTPTANSADRRSGPLVAASMVALVLAACGSPEEDSDVIRSIDPVAATTTTSPEIMSETTQPQVDVVPITTAATERLQGGPGQEIPEVTIDSSAGVQKGGPGEQVADPEIEQASSAFEQLIQTQATGIVETLFSHDNLEVADNKLTAQWGDENRSRTRSVEVNLGESILVVRDEGELAFGGPKDYTKSLAIETTFALEGASIDVASLDQAAIAELIATSEPTSIEVSTDEYFPEGEGLPAGGDKSESTTTLKLGEDGAIVLTLAKRHAGHDWDPEISETGPGVGAQMDQALALFQHFTVYELGV